MRALFHRLSPEDIYTRFFKRMRSLSFMELQTLCNVNHDTEVAFLAVTGPRENEMVVGSGCYFLSPTTNLAEVAFMVAPEWQGAGLGTALQDRLQEYAIGRGVRGFIAGDPAAQRAHVAVGAPCLWGVTTSRDEDAVHVTITFGDLAEDRMLRRAGTHSEGAPVSPQCSVGTVQPDEAVQVVAPPHRCHQAAIA